MCRLLCNHKEALKYTDYANFLLKNFFILMEKFYGNSSQVINFHNLIHLADDVKYMSGPLSSFSSFPFESTLCKIKNLVRSSRNPLTQVLNRLEEQDALPENFVQPRLDVSKCTMQTKSNTERLIKEIKVKEMILSASKPNNTIQLKNGLHIKIKNIYLQKENTAVQ